MSFEYLLLFDGNILPSKPGIGKLFMKGQIVNSFVFVGLMVSLTNTQLYCKDLTLQ